MIPKGFQFSGVRCGLKNRRADLGMIVSDRPAKIAGVLTTNQVRAACVDHTRKVIDGGRFKALVVNSGNANCCTGEQGQKDAYTMAAATGQLVGCSPEEAVVASTGVIGQLLDMTKVHKGITDAHMALGTDPKPFMEAILTTDLVEKQAEAELPGGAIVYGVAKGSGMISPNMATMFAFVVTDADCEEIDLQAVISRVTRSTFNRMTIDSDTSTNDMFLVIANGASGVKPSEAELESAVRDVSLSLTKQIAKDGEGASKLIEVVVKGTSDPDTVARSIANSPLVKTAMYGCDPNWGRIMMAAGKCGVPFDPSRAKLTLVTAGETHVLFENGGPAAFDPFHAAASLKSDHVIIDLDLGSGETSTIYTCDFSYGYIRINAEYHT